MPLIHRRQDRLYKVWCNMKQRCYNTCSPAYRYYGARGIVVCDAWRTNFMVFRAWALSHPAYTPTMSIERKNNDGNYGPENCTWIPICDQPKNQRGKRWVVAFSERKGMSDWSRDARCVVSLGALWNRLERGWEPERAITQP